MGIFSFLKANKNHLTKEEKYFAGNLNLNIRKKHLAILLDENLFAVSKLVYDLSAKRANVKAFDVNAETDVDVLFTKPDILQHIELYRAMPKIMKTTISMILLEFKKGKSEEETRKLTEDIFLPILIETADRLKKI